MGHRCKCGRRCEGLGGCAWCQAEVGWEWPAPIPVDVYIEKELGRGEPPIPDEAA